MESIKIAVYVSEKVALAARSPKCGRGEYTPAEVELAELTPAEIAVLPGYTFTGQISQTNPSASLHLTAATVDWPTIRAALTARLAELEAEKSAKAATLEQNVQETLEKIAATRPLWKVSGSGYNHEVRMADYFPHLSGYCNRVDDDPRVKAALEARLDELRAVEAEAKRLNTEAKARALADEVAAEQRKAEREAKKTEALAALYAWAGTQVQGAHIPAAVERGYDCKSEAMSLLADFVMDRLDETPDQILIEDKGDWRKWSWARRNNPSVEALALETSLEHLAEGLRPDLPKHASVTIGYVSLVEHDTGEDEYGENTSDKRTMIPITIAVPGIKERVALVNCE